MLNKKLVKILQVSLIIFGLIGLSLTLFSQFHYGKITETNPATAKINQILKINDAEIKIEIARSEPEMSRGLSGRISLPADSGLLFVYQENIVPAFWMKEMNFPIDIIWLDESKTVVDVTKNISPSTFPQTFSPNAPIKYVLEVNANFADKHEIKIGDKAAFSLAPGVL